MSMCMKAFSYISKSKDYWFVEILEWKTVTKEDNFKPEFIDNDTSSNNQSKGQLTLQNVL